MYQFKLKPIQASARARKTRRVERFIQSIPHAAVPPPLIVTAARPISSPPKKKKRGPEDKDRAPVLQLRKRLKTALPALESFDPHINTNINDDDDDDSTRDKQPPAAGGTESPVIIADEVNEGEEVDALLAGAGNPSYQTQPMEVVGRPARVEGTSKTSVQYGGGKQTTKEKHKSPTGLLSSGIPMSVQRRRPTGEEPKKSPETPTTSNTTKTSSSPFHVPASKSLREASLKDKAVGKHTKSCKVRGTDGQERTKIAEMAQTGGSRLSGGEKGREKGKEREKERERQKAKAREREKEREKKKEREKEKEREKKKEREKEKEREKSKEREKEKERKKEKEREKTKEREKETEREKEKEKERDTAKGGKDKEEEKQQREKKQKDRDKTSSKEKRAKHGSEGKISEEPEERWDEATTNGHVETITTEHQQDGEKGQQHVSKTQAPDISERNKVLEHQVQTHRHEARRLRLENEVLSSLLTRLTSAAGDDKNALDEAREVLLSMREKDCAEREKELESREQELAKRRQEFEKASRKGTKTQQLEEGDQVNEEPEFPSVYLGSDDESVFTQGI